MPYTCGAAWGRGCKKAVARDPCKWPGFGDIRPPEGCDVPLPTLQYWAVRI